MAFGKNKPNISSPSQEFDQPIEVALGRQSLGSASIEEIIVKSIASIAIGGSQASSFNTLEKMKSAGDKFNFKSGIEGMKAQLKRVNETLSDISKNIDSTSKTIVAMKDTMALKLDAVEQAIVASLIASNTNNSIESEKMSNELKIVFEGENALEIFDKLSEMAADDDIGNLSGALNSLTNNVSDIDKFSKSLEPLTKAMSEFMPICKSLNESSNILKEFADNLISVAGPLDDISINLKPFKEIYSFLQDISNNPINKNDINNISNSLVLFSGLSDNIKVVSSSIKDIDINVEPLKAILSLLENIPSINEQNVKVACSSSKILVEFATYVKSISDQLQGISINTKSLDAMIELLNNIPFVNEDNIESVCTSLTLFSDMSSKIQSFANIVSSLKNMNVKSLKDILLLLEDFSKNTINDQNIKTACDSLNTLTEFANNAKILSQQLNEINNLNLEPIKTIQNFLENIPSIDKNNIQTICNYLETFNEIVSNLDLSSIDPSKFDNIKAINDRLKSINDLKDIDFSGLENVKNQMDNLSLFIKNLNNIPEFSNKAILADLVNSISDIKDILEKTKDVDKRMGAGLNNLINSLDPLSNLTRIKIRKDVVKSLIKSLENFDKLFPSLSRFSESLNSLDLKNINRNAWALSNSLKYVSEIEFDGIENVDKKALEETIKSGVIENMIYIVSKINDVPKQDYIDASTSIDFLKTILERFSLLKLYPNKSLDKTNLTNFIATVDIMNEIAKHLVEIKFKKENKKTIDRLLECLMLISHIKIKNVNKEKYEGLKNVSLSLAAIAHTLSNIGKIDNLHEFELFVKKVFTNKNAIMKSVISSISGMSLDKETIKKANAISDLLFKLAKVCQTLSIVGSLAKFAEAGVNVLNRVIDSTQTIIDKFASIDNKRLKRAEHIVKSIGMLIAMSTICMLIGGAFMLFFPKVVIASLAFGLALGLFIMTVIGTINLASRGLKTAGDTLRGVALLVIASAFVMMLGAAFVLSSPKLLIASLAFGLALGLFIFTVLASIVIASKIGGIDFVKNTLKEVALLVMASAFVMMLGAAFMTIPGMFKNAMAFTAALAVFLIGTLGPLTLASVFMKKAKMAAKDFAIIIMASAFVMMIGAAFIEIDGMLENCFIFAGAMATFLVATLGPLTLASIFMKKAKMAAKDFAIIVGVSAAVLLIGGGLFMKYPELPGHVITFGVILSTFIFVVTSALKFLGNNSSNVMKGAAAMAIIAGVVLIASSSMLIIRKAVEGATTDLIAGVAIMSGTLLAVGAMAMALGALATAGGAFFWAGIGAMAAISGMVLLASIAMQNIANSMKTFKEVQGIDFKPILATLVDMLSLVDPLTTFGKHSLAIWMASKAIERLAITISKMSETVQEASSLKIAIYEGTKKVGYRTLKKSDFKEASENIKTIITILGKTILSTYKKNPEMFSNTLIGDNPFTRVVKSTTGLANMISKISFAVKDYADLKIPEYSGTKITRYRHLGPEDFTKAGENVKNIVRTLSDALISLYNENKEIYTDNSLLGKVFGESAGNTPLSRVIAISSKLGNLISKIASGVSDMATLKFPIYKDGKIVSYRKLSDAEIVQAGENTKTIVSTLSNALIDLYNEGNNKDMYDTPWYSTSTKPSDTPLGRVIGVSMTIGKLISKIASGVKDMAELRIPEEYNKDGKAIKFRQMTDAEIKKAGENVKSIVMTFSTALIDLYNEGNNKDMYDTPWYSTSTKPSDTPLGRVIGVSMTIGKLISKIASGVKDMAELRIPEEYNKDGKAIKFRQMTDAEIKQAGRNVLDVTSALGNGLMNTYDAHKEWFDGKIEKTPFYKVITLSTKLGDMIGKIGDAVGKMAKLQIPDAYDKNGKIIKYRQLNDNDFKNASTNVGKVITTLGSAIMSLYDDPKTKSWFCNEDGEILKDKKSPFTIVVKTTMNLSETISKIAKAMKDYAKLRIPLKYDSKGNVIEYEQMGRIHFENASSNIGLIITNVGDAMMKVYKANKDWFEEGGNILKKEDSKFAKTLAACISMGEMISNISSGIIAMAQLMIPDNWDKTGKPIHFRQMNETDFTNASTNVGKVVTTIGGALIDLYDNNKNGMFTSQDNEDTPFNKVAEGCSYLGDLVKNIAEGVSEMATLETTLKKQGIDVNFDKAAENIEKVVNCIGNALMTQFGAHKDWFEKPVKVDVAWGLFKKRDEKADTPFQMMMNASMSMGAMITSIGKGISFFATQTKDIKNIPTASENIKTILRAIGEAICEVAKDPQWNNMEKISGVISNVHKSANAVSAIADMLKKIGNGVIIITDKDGNKINEIKLDKATIDKSAKTIGDIITGISNGLENAQKVSEKSPFSLFNEASAKSMTLVLDMVKKAANVVGKNAQLLATLGQNKLKYKDKTGKETEIDISDSNMSKGALRIKNVITYVSEGISNAYKVITENKDFDVEKSSKIVELVGNAVNTIASNALILRFMASGEYPLINEKTGDIIEKIKVSTNDLESGSSRIGNVISKIAIGLKSGVDNVKSYIGDDSFEKSAMYKTIQGVQQAVNVVGDMAFFLANLSKNEYVYYDERSKANKTIKFGNLENLTKAASAIGSIISSIATQMTLGTSIASVAFGDKPYESSDVKKTLVAVGEAKDTVGGMALFLAHLAKNEYTYYDTRKKSEQTIKFGSLENLTQAASAIGSIISSIAAGLKDGTSNAYTALGTTLYQGSQMQQTIDAVSQAKDAVGPLVLFIGGLASGVYSFKDENGETKTISLTDDETIKKVTGNISSIIASIAQTIIDATNKLGNANFIGWQNSPNSPISSMFDSISKATTMLGNVAYLVDKYSAGDIPVAQGIVVSPNIEQAKKNMESIVFGVVDIIKGSEEKIKEITGIDDTLATLNKSLVIVKTSLNVANAIAAAKENILSLANINIGEILTPVIADIKKSFDALNAIGSEQKTVSLFGIDINVESPVKAFLNDIDSLIEQANTIANTPMITSYDILNQTITSTMDTMSKVKMPENFGKQVQDLSKFIKTVNTIKIDGVDALTELLKELNKMGINMGNLDKLTNAISNKLTITLQQCGKIMKELNKTINEDAARKEKHKKEIKTSVDEISKAMSQTMNVLVKMDESEGSSSIGSTISADDTSSKGTPAKTPPGNGYKS